MKAPRIDRRTILRGIGGVAIGLPFIEEMAASSALAAAKAPVPARAFNVFFGLGIPKPLQVEGYDGVMEPLKPLADKLLIVREVDHVRCDKPGINAHFDGATAAFTAMPPDGEAKSGGASIDQRVRQAHHPKGMPAGMVPTLVAGTFFRRSRIGRYVHSYNPDGTVAAAMQEKPRELFDRVFGAVNTGDETDASKRRVKLSVLDAVVDQYRHYTGKNSPLGATSKARLADHLDRIREFEQRAFSLKPLGDDAPDLPPASGLAHGGRADPGGEGLDMRLDDLTTEWRLLADLYALAIQTDRVRFGSLTFLAAGERLRMTGDYIYNGEKRYAFNDAKQLKKGGSGGCSHEWWHKFREGKPNTQLRTHAHMKLREVAYFLSRLDGDDARDANGRSILENAMITVSTESGDGRHANTKRELSGVFHAISGAGGRLKTGQIIDAKAEGLDVYNTMLGAVGVKGRLGPSDRPFNRVDKILA